MLIVGIVVVFAFELLTTLFGSVPDETPLWSWLTQVSATLLGTIAGVAVGLWLFEYQSHKADETKEDQLLTALAGETQSILNILQGPVRPIWGPGGLVLDEVVTVSLPTLVAQEAIRSGVFYSSEVLLLSNIVDHLQIHNNLLFFILSAQVGTVYRATLENLLQELKSRQRDICQSSRSLLTHLESVGIRVPSSQEG